MLTHEATVGEIVDDVERLGLLGRHMEEELVNHILPFWIRRTPDRKRGGFVGRISGRGSVDARAGRGVILNTRILWTFSAAYRRYSTKAYLDIAERAFLYIVDYFWDHEHAGLYWMVDHDGKPRDTRKHVYAQAFGLYSLGEYALATDSSDATAYVQQLYETIEHRCHDDRDGGYFEAFDRSWQLLDDARLSPKDSNVPKSMNVHLHLLEAYTVLLSLLDEPGVRVRTEELVRLFLDRIVDPGRSQVYPFFEADWTAVSRTVSYGHDIEASWLLVRAAEALGDETILDKARQNALSMVDRVLLDGVDVDGGLLNERQENGKLDDDKHWWPQAEAIVGFVEAFQQTRRSEYLHAAEKTWEFVRKRIIDRRHGEWFFRVPRTGRPSRKEDKVGPWKGPYHNGRACLEVSDRAGKQ